MNLSTTVIKTATRHPSVIIMDYYQYNNVRKQSTWFDSNVHLFTYLAFLIIWSPLMLFLVRSKRSRFVINLHTLRLNTKCLGDDITQTEDRMKIV